MTAFSIRKSGRCKNCGTQERPHKAEGLCTRCYYREYKREKKKEALAKAKQAPGGGVDNP